MVKIVAIVNKKMASNKYNLFIIGSLKYDSLDGLLLLLTKMNFPKNRIFRSNLKDYGWSFRKTITA